MTSFSSPASLPTGASTVASCGSFWRILGRRFAVEVLPPGALYWVSSSTSRGSRHIFFCGLLWAFPHLCDSPCWNYPFPFGGTIRWFLAIFTVDKAIPSIGLRGSLCPRAAVPVGEAPLTGGFWVTVTRASEQDGRCPLMYAGG